MNTFILSLHILLALVMTGATAGVFVAGYRRLASRVYEIMLGSFGATLASGVVLLFATGHGFGRFCVMMTAFGFATVAARRYYRMRLPARSPSL